MNQSPAPDDELRILTGQLRDYLDVLRMWGVQHVPMDRLPEAISSQPGVPQALHPPELAQGQVRADSQPGLAVASQETQELPFASQVSLDPLSRRSLTELEAVAKQCTQCRLHRGRTHVVFGVGNPHAELMFIGEAPGRDEDLQGEPFVGRAGQLLTRIIEAIGMTRRDVYITNVIKCRPPNNRNPEADEIARCEPYLIRQIGLVKPRMIVALGTFAAQTLLKTKMPISQLRGRFHTYQGVRVMPTFHPAFLLRNPERKRAVWEDMQAVQRELRQPPA
ncbi:MAG TPA: uracil-DNA glycosylase [Candidatus Tectomicrobia bacterium]|nr:uracil-DNA glycosylase [Candidatus Tectomicrobia bacterium]